MKPMFRQKRFRVPLAILAAVGVLAGVWLATESWRNGQGDVKQQSVAFTKYVAADRQGDPRFTQNGGAIEFAAKPYGTVYEFAVQEGQAIVPPYACSIKTYIDALTGENTALLHAEMARETPQCITKIGQNKYDKPVYQQDPAFTGEFFYYYTRVEQTNIVIKVPLERVLDPAADVNDVVIGIVNSLQPYGGKIDEPQR